MSASYEVTVHYVIPPPNLPKIPVILPATSDSYFPVRRIFCVGRNYANHVIEMGEDPRTESPCFFMKPSHSIVPCGKRSASAAVPPQSIVYPLATHDLHYEVELVVALGSPTMLVSGVCNVPVADAASLIYGYAIGVDLTRRDLQSIAKKKGLPWCSSKGFDQSAPIGNIYPISDTQVHEKLHMPLSTTSMQADRKLDDGNVASSAKLWLTVNGTERQSGFPVRQMIWSVPEIISALSLQFALQPGDLIFTGTPEGVGPVHPGDHVMAGMDGCLGALEFVMPPRE